MPGVSFAVADDHRDEHRLAAFVAEQDQSLRRGERHLVSVVERLLQRRNRVARSQLSRRQRRILADQWVFVMKRRRGHLHAVFVGLAQHHQRSQRLPLLEAAG
jgi:hypothetical protein